MSYFEQIVAHINSSSEVDYWSERHFGKIYVYRFGSHNDIVVRHGATSIGVSLNPFLRNNDWMIRVPVSPSEFKCLSISREGAEELADLLCSNGERPTERLVSDAHDLMGAIMIQNRKKYGAFLERADSTDSLSDRIYAIRSGFSGPKWIRVRVTPCGEYCNLSTRESMHGSETSGVYSTKLDAAVQSFAVFGLEPSVQESVRSELKAILAEMSHGIQAA